MDEKKTITTPAKTSDSPIVAINNSYPETWQRVSIDNPIQIVEKWQEPREVSRATGK